MRDGRYALRAGWWYPASPCARGFRGNDAQRPTVAAICVGSGVVPPGWSRGAVEARRRPRFDYGEMARSRVRSRSRLRFARPQRSAGISATKREVRVSFDEFGDEVEVLIGCLLPGGLPGDRGAGARRSIYRLSRPATPVRRPWGRSVRCAYASRTPSPIAVSRPDRSAQLRMRRVSRSQRSRRSDVRGPREGPHGVRSGGTDRKPLRHRPGRCAA